MLGGILFLAIPGSSCVVVHAQGDEERPPIIVDASEIVFSHGHPWRPQGSGKKFKPYHTRGMDATGYEVIVVNKDSRPPTVCTASGKNVAIDFTVAGAGVAHRFTLALEPRGGGSPIHDPTLISEVDLTPVAGNPRRVRFPKDGQITNILVDGKPCRVNWTSGVRVIAFITQQRVTPARGRRRGPGEALPPSMDPDRP